MGRGFFGSPEFGGGGIEGRDFRSRPEVRPSPHIPPPVPRKTYRPRPPSPEPRPRQGVEFPGRLRADTPRPQRPPRPETVRAAKIELKAGFAHRDGVAVRRLKVSKVRRIEIRDARGVQVGPKSHQVNHYRYQVKRPQVSLDRLLQGRSGL